MEKPGISGVSVAVRRGSSLLLVRRGRDPWKGLYAFPGGRVEKRETLEQAARREILEETGLALGELRLLQVLDLPSPAATFRLHVFVTELAQGEPAAADDAEEAGWFNLEEMSGMPLTESTHAIALELLQPIPPQR